MSRIILALDGLSWAECQALIATLPANKHTFKVHDLVDRQGPSVIRALLLAGAKTVWVDYKLHDIPETVRRRVAALVGHGAGIISVHGSGGIPMLRAAKQAAGRSLVHAVTVLTSLWPDQTQLLYGGSPIQVTTRIAKQAFESGIDGIVCSAQEAKIVAGLREVKNKHIVTPGIRLSCSEKHDQARTTTPVEALQNGATHLVVGRDIIGAKDPRAILQKYEAAIAGLRNE